MCTLRTWLGELEPRETPAVATGSFANITTLAGNGASSAALTVTYEADPGEAIDTATLGANDLRVTGPGYNQPANFTGFTDKNGNQSVIVANYSIVANPLGTSGWDIADNGDYSVALQSGAVKTQTGADVTAGTINMFQVAIGKSYVVSTSADSGAGSLRAVLAAAKTDTPTALDLITFSPAHFNTTRTIALQSELVIDSDVMITGPGAKLVLDPAIADTRALSVSDGGPGRVTALASNLMIVNGGGALNGGGVFVGEADSLTLTDCDISHNSGNAGGGIFVGQDGSLSLTRTTVSGNSATGVGGGVYFFNNGALNVDASSITGNVADSSAGGGGLYFFGTAAKDSLRIVNSTVSGNTANNGGGIVLRAGSDTTVLQVFNSTIAANSALFGGGIARPSGAGMILLVSSIVSGNTATDDPDLFLADNVLGATFSALGTGTGTAWEAAYTSAGSNLPFGSDLKLQTLALNGSGFTKSHALGIGSAAREKGSNPIGLTLDQTGAPRLNGAIDIGSFERVPGQPVAGVGMLATVTANSAANNPYTFTVTYADDTAISKATVGDAADVQINRVGGGFSVNATFVSVTPNVNAATLTATYKLTPPGGTWDGGDNGVYSVDLLANAVKNTAGAAIAASTLGSFTVGVPQTFTVSNTADTGAGTLRQAILDANAAADVADTIVFDPTFFGTPRTISLASELSITDAVTITGPGASLLSVSGGGTTRLVHVNGSDRIAVSLSGLTLTNGKATGNGGAVLFDNELVTLTGCTVTANTASDNGGAFSMSDIGALTLIQCTVSGNKALADDGGAINMDGAGRLVIQESTVSGNSAAGEGGGAYFFTGGSLRVERSTLSGNLSGGSLGGGALYFFGAVDSDDVVIINSTLSGNSAAGQGGAILFRSLVTGSDNDIQIRNGTVTLNSSGVVIASGSGTATVVSSILVGNGVDTLGAITASYSSIGSAGAGYVAGTSNLAAGFNLNLGPLANNGGPTLTHLPGSGSAALDKGSNPSSLTLDQRGLLRANGTIDIGAVEAQAAGTPVVTGFTVNNGAAQRSRLTTVTINFAGPVTPAAAGAIALTRTTGVAAIVQTGAVGANGLVSVAQGTGTSLVLSFRNANGAGISEGVEYGSLSSGRWRLSVPAAGYQSNLNDPSLRRLFGDLNGDGTVDGGNDFASFKFLTAVNDPFDFNADGVVDGSTDFSTFGGYFGKSI